MSVPLFSFIFKFTPLTETRTPVLRLKAPCSNPVELSGNMYRTDGTRTHNLSHRKRMLCSIELRSCYGERIACFQYREGRTRTDDYLFVRQAF